MKALLVLVTLLILAAATLVAYASAGVPAEVGTLGSLTWKEPATLLISGSALIGAASAVRRLPF